jgi:hypothetical protein
MCALAIDIAVNADGGAKAVAAGPGVTAALYLPAVWASATRTPHRQRVLQVTLIVSLIVAFVGSVFLGIVHLLVLAPATVLLWLATRSGR